MASLKESDFNELYEALHYMNMAELKEVCAKLHLSFKGQKSDLIKAIMSFLQTGNVAKVSSLPEAAKAKKNVSYPLAPKTYILSGNYKNDAPTRAFMKSLIGAHFHFTAFGQDWIRERWKEGSPPTYAEFAAFWQKEYEARKKRKATPKKEWAYLTFIQKYSQDHPHVSRQQISDAWGKHLEIQVKKAIDLLRKIHL